MTDGFFCSYNRIQNGTGYGEKLFSISAVFIAYGCADIFINGIKSTVKRGEFFVAFPTDRLEIVPQGTLGYISFGFLSDAVPGVSEDITNILFLCRKNGGARIFSPDAPNCDDIENVFSDALREYNGASPGANFALCADAARIIRAVCSDKIKVCGAMYERYFDIAGYLNENLSCADAKSTAERFGVGYSYFSRTFANVFGKPFKEYINFLRVDSGAKLLLTTDLSVAEVSDKLGFATPSHFINVFAKIKGISPGQYRKEAR